MTKPDLSEFAQHESRGPMKTPEYSTRITENQAGWSIDATRPDGPPSDDDIRAILTGAGCDPDLYEWRVTSISWNSASWHRSAEVAATPKPHTAYTSPACTVKISITRKEDALLPFVATQAQPVKLTLSSTRRLPKRRSIEGMETAVIFPDAQMSYWQDRDGTWRTTHDESALDVSMQILADVEAEHGVDVVVDLGDLVDLPFFSTHPSPLAMLKLESFNRTLNRGHQLLAARTALTPSARLRRWIRGNHEQRFIEFLAKFAPQLVGLVLPGQAMDSPVLSLPFLMRLDEIGWVMDAESSYPNDVLWLTHNLRCIHGTIGKTKVGDTLNAYLTEGDFSTIAGHTPHAGLGYRTVSSNGRTRTYLAHTPGGFMRVDGAVPSQSTKNNDWGEPSKSDGVRWEQGFSVVHYDPQGSVVPQIEHIAIFGGHAVWRGKEYVARVDVDGNGIEEAA